MIGVDFLTAERFLQALDPAGQFTFQTFDDTPRNDTYLARVFQGTFGEHRDELARLNSAGAGVFITPNKTDGRGRKTENITGVRAVFLDLDGTPLPEEWPIEPHLIIESSPERFHAYWLLDPGFPLDRFEGVQKALAARFNGDPAVCDLPRVMRLPGFVHRKKEPFQSRILRDWSSEPQYAPEQILEVFPPVSETKSRPNVDPGDDLILKALSAKELLIAPGRERGMYRITCPWASEHTNGDKEAVYYLPNFGGFKGPGFKCQHAHCADRTIKDLREFLGIASKEKPDDGSFELVRVSELWDEQEDETEWAVEGLLPAGSMAILGSRPKMGKSTFARCMALSVASGEPFLDELETLHGDVIYMALEENRRAVVRAFKTVALRGFGMDEARAREVLSHIGLITGTTPKDFSKKLTALVERHQPVLIVVDTLIRLLKLQDSNAYSETSAGLEPLLHLAHERNISVLLLHHTKKSDQGELLGSTGIAASADVILALGKKDGTRTLAAEGRGVAFEPVTLNFRPESLYYSMGVPVDEAEIHVVMGRIRGFMGDHPDAPVFWKDLQSGVEGRKQTKNEALRRLENEGVIERRGTPRSKKDPLHFILVPKGSHNTREPRYQDAENGSGPSRILVPENLGSQENVKNPGTKMTPENELVDAEVF